MDLVIWNGSSGYSVNVIEFFFKPHYVFVPYKGGGVYFPLH